MAFDSARGRAVLFWRHVLHHRPNHVWPDVGMERFDLDDRFNERTFAATPARDGVRRSTANTVMFGGLADGSFRDTATWTWNGSTRSQATTSGPVTRFGHAMAYDAARQKVVLFGGFGGSGDVKTSCKTRGSGTEARGQDGVDRPFA